MQSALASLSSKERGSASDARGVQLRILDRVSEEVTQDTFLKSVSTTIRVPNGYAM
jgi:hypothetical protein